MDVQGRLLGFDFGRKRIGVAVGETVTGSARPLAVLPARQGAPRWEAVGALIEQWRPVALVVGLPVHLDGSEHELTRAARRFGNRLHGRYHLPVFFQDERLTSDEARRERGGAGPVDDLAAALILRDWLAGSAPATE